VKAELSKPPVLPPQIGVLPLGVGAVAVSSDIEMFSQIAYMLLISKAKISFLYTPASSLLNVTLRSLTKLLEKISREARYFLV
jgi:hypothetical protein